MIRKAGQRLMRKLKTTESTGERVRQARRYQKRPGDLPSRVRVGSIRLSRN